LAARRLHVADPVGDDAEEVVDPEDHEAMTPEVESDAGQDAATYAAGPFYGVDDLLHVLCEGRAAVLRPLARPQERRVLGVHPREPLVPRPGRELSADERGELLLPIEALLRVRRHGGPPACARS